MENPPKKLKTRKENPESLSGNTSSSGKNTDKSLKLILSDGSLQFCLKLYNELRGEKNAVFSPFSVRVALSMLAAGAGGTTLAQMKDVLELNGFPTEVETGQAFREHLDSFSSINSFLSFSTANRIYLRDSFPILPSFSQSLQEYYQSSALHVDFQTDSGGLTRAINDWVQQETNNRVKEMVSLESISADTVLVLLNAVSFKGKWELPFNPDNTDLRLFNLADGRTILVPTMFQKDYFNYTFSAALKSQVLQLNYKDDRFAMLIVLPEKGTSLATIQQNLNVENINDFMTKFSAKEVEVYLPKFKESYKKELTGSLRSLNMNEVFEASADLRKVSCEPGVYLSSVLHQAFLAVDEEGTEAAAGAFCVECWGLDAEPEPIQFIVDRPCIYFIYDLDFKQVLFMGNLDDPSSSFS